MNLIGGAETMETIEHADKVPKEMEFALNYLTAETNGETAKNAANNFEENLNLARGVPSAGGRKGPPWNIPTHTA